jgi:hypothetical protein
MKRTHTVSLCFHLSSVDIDTELEHPENFTAQASGHD